MCARLAVFAGGFELEAAEASAPTTGWPPGEVLDLLAALVDKSLLVAEHGEGGPGTGCWRRCASTGRNACRASGEDTALRRRHRDWHEQLAGRADTGWLSPQIAEWTARLFREHANVNAAQDFCQAEPGEAEAGLRIALHVWHFYYWDPGHVSEGRYRLGQALARAGEPTVWRARGLLVASFLAGVSGDRGAARALLEQGTSLAGQLDDPATSAFAAWAAGTVCALAGDLYQAIAQSKSGWRSCPRRRPRPPARPPADRPGHAAGLAGDEERAVACHREIAALTEAGGEYVRRWHSAYSL